MYYSTESVEILFYSVKFIYNYSTCKEAVIVYSVCKVDALFYSVRSTSFQNFDVFAYFMCL